MAQGTVQTPAWGDKGAIRAALAEARKRTRLLIAPLLDASLETAAAPFLSPPVWDLGHVANFEERWLVQALAGDAEMHAGDNDRYDARLHPRPERSLLRLLDAAGAQRYLDEVRARALEVLERVDTGPAAPRLTRDGFVHRLMVLHEHQHQETLLQTIQMRAGAYTPAEVHPAPAPRVPAPADAWIDVPAGPFVMGREQGTGVYDNEAPAHVAETEAFQVARFPVTCGEYLGFVMEGGYEDRGLWSAAGRDWLDGEDHHAPLHWQWRDGAWHRRSVLGTEPVHRVGDEILCHVSWFEAEAYARYAGARLPSEAEWEKACRLDPGAREPDGVVVPTAPTVRGPAQGPAQANIDHLAWGPSRVGAYPGGATPLGLEHAFGDVWEWTASEFTGYPGFHAFPYCDYSEVFFGTGHRVLRGGSWATRAGCAHATFRNWDLPERRQVFAGIRLAR